MKYDYLKFNDFCSRKITKGRIMKGERLEHIYQVYNQQRINVWNIQEILVHKQKKKRQKIQQKVQDPYPSSMCYFFS